MSKEEVIQTIAHNGYKVIDENFEYKNNNVKIAIEDNAGYRYFSTLFHIKFRGNPFMVHESNPFSLYNIRHYIKLNNLPCKLIDGKYINEHTKLKFECECGSVFYRRFADLRKSTGRCRSCVKQKSSYERKCEDLLNNLNIYFKPQHYISENTNRYFFDFAIFYKNREAYIEIDGAQHFRFIRHWHKNEAGFQLQKERDTRKNNYCAKNSIPLLRIPYYEFQSDSYQYIIKNFIKQTFA